MTNYLIMGEYRNETEELDSAEDVQEADFLVGEYRIAFSKNWHIWWEGNNAKRTNMDTD